MLTSNSKYGPTLCTRLSCHPTTPKTAAQVRTPSPGHRSADAISVSVDVSDGGLYMRSPLQLGRTGWGNGSLGR